MGQTYTVELKNIKVKNEPDLVKRSNEYFKSIDVANKEKFINLKTFDEVLSAVFPNLENGKVASYFADFDASYGWESVMYEWFEAVAPDLAEGSSIEVWPDSGSWGLVVNSSGGIEKLVKKKPKYVLPFDRLHFRKLHRFNPKKLDSGVIAHVRSVGDEAICVDEYKENDRDDLISYYEYEVEGRGNRYVKYILDSLKNGDTVIWDPKVPRDRGVPTKNESANEGKTTLKLKGNNMVEIPIEKKKFVVFDRGGNHIDSFAKDYDAVKFLKSNAMVGYVEDQDTDRVIWSNTRSMKVDEGAEGKRDPGFEYVIYDCTDERLGQCPVVALRSTRTEAEYATNRLTGRMYGKPGPKKFRGKELTFEKVPKGKFKVGDNFYGPFDQDYNRLESLNEDAEITKDNFENLKVGDTIVDPRGKEYKVTRVGYRHYNFDWANNKPYSDPKAEMTITAVGGNNTLNDFPFSEFKGWRVKKLTESLTEAKSAKKLIYELKDRFVAHQLHGVDSQFRNEFDAGKKYREISNDPSFKHGFIGVKHKTYRAGVNQWVKDVQPTEFMVFTRKENPSWKDDVLDVFYKKETVVEDFDFSKEVGTKKDNKGNIYYIFRNNTNGKVVWKATPQDKTTYSPDVTKAFDITYKQATGEDPIKEPSLGKELGKKLGLRR